MALTHASLSEMIARSIVVPAQIRFRKKEAADSVVAHDSSPLLMMPVDRKKVRVVAELCQ